MALRDERGRLIGSGIYNPKSKIIWRRYSRKNIAFDAAFLEAALKRAIALRAPDSCRRLVWAEADDLPGLIVDQYGEVLCVQALTLAVDEALPTICRILKEQLSPAEIVLRNDAPVRKHEGLSATVTTLSGKKPEAFELEVGGIRYTVDLSAGHKTGLYLDQRKEHLNVAELAKGKRVLDGFCNQGGFALQCARAGASEVVAIDISGDCITQAKENAQRNGLQVDFREENMFDYFTKNREERFDLIILDPPSFARNRASLGNALRGYKELHLRALRQLNPNGILATYSCSQHVDIDSFLRTLEEAASDCGKKLVLRYRSAQPADHPVVIGIPETEYLKGVVVQVMDETS